MVVARGRRRYAWRGKGPRASMNIIRVIFVMALELTVIYTRETDRVPMTASDLSRPSLLPVDRAEGPPSPPPAPPDSAPEAKENQNPQKQKVVACSSSSLLRDLPGFAIRGNCPGGERDSARPPPSVWNFQSHTGLSAIAF